ncbi:hypothetical protein V3481_002224 [Fusarium oxysporum f. sp. vasinfectum]
MSDGFENLEHYFGRETISLKPQWHRSITTENAHAVLAELCVLYLNFFNSDASLPAGANGEARDYVNSYAFVDYSAKSWGTHFREPSIIDDAAIVPLAAKICNPDSKSFST